jgi:hypothetical protein
MCASILCILAHSYLSKQNIQNCHVIVTYDFIQCTVKPCHVILYWPWPYTGARVAQWVRLLDLTAHTSLSCHVILHWPYILYLSKKLRSYLMTFAIQWKGCFPHYEKSYNLKLNCLVCYEISHWQKDVFSIQYKYSSYDI